MPRGKVIVRNFKCHKNFETEMKELNILTGSNATGKSSFVQALLLAFKSWESCEKNRSIPTEGHRTIIVRVGPHCQE
ncbi:MAG: ATP-binding protein [Lachnospiraceae bacterium]|nr:ATP-binding protein [Lachnospiraceae bacterium]